MSDAVALLHGADARLQRLVAEFTAPTLSASTPCASWDARALLSHTLLTIEAFSAAVDGGDGPTGEQLFGGADILGTDPDGVTKRIVTRSHAAWAGITDWDRQLETILGPLPASQGIAIVTFSTLVHSWDLAQALGEKVEFTDGEAAVAEAVAGVVVPMLRPQGLFADEVGVADGVSPTQRVVALTGRSPL